jgi:hypothetical protein
MSAFCLSIVFACMMGSVWTLFRDRLTQIRFVAPSFATAVLLFVLA